MPAHPEFLEDFRAGIALGTLPAGVTATAPDEVAQRFAVYRNNVTVGLVDALAARFPVIQRLVGVAFFRAVAREFARAHPPRSPLLFLWGEAFPDFLAALPSLADYPYTADVARIEVARGVAYHAADAMPLPVSDLLAAVADPGRVHLHLHPSVQVMRLSHPAVSIWAANQPGAAAVVTARMPETALIWRDARFDVGVAAVEAGDAAMIEALIAGESLMRAAELAARVDENHNPEPMLVRLMQAGVIVMPGKANP